MVDYTHFNVSREDKCYLIYGRLSQNNQTVRSNSWKYDSNYKQTDHTYAYLAGSHKLISPLQLNFPGKLNSTR